MGRFTSKVPVCLLAWACRVRGIRAQVCLCLSGVRRRGKPATGYSSGVTKLFIVVENKKPQGREGEAGSRGSHHVHTEGRKWEGPSVQVLVMSQEGKEGQAECLSACLERLVFAGMAVGSMEKRTLVGCFCNNMLE